MFAAAAAAAAAAQQAQQDIRISDADAHRPDDYIEEGTGDGTTKPAGSQIKAHMSGGNKSGVPHRARRTRSNPAYM
jgi:hypothetical protein